jgi:hypothetical protein
MCQRGPISMEGADVGCQGITISVLRGDICALLYFVGLHMASHRQSRCRGQGGDSATGSQERPGKFCNMRGLNVASYNGEASSLRISGGLTNVPRP